MIVSVTTGLVQECPPSLVKNETQLISGGFSDYSTTSGTKTIKKGHVVDVLAAYANGGTALNSYRAIRDIGSQALGTEDYSVTADYLDLGTTVSWNLDGEKTNDLVIKALPDIAGGGLNTLGHLQSESPG